MKLVWLRSAEPDLEALTDYIAQKNPRTALQIFTTIRLSIEKLTQFPFAGREGRVKETRELIIPNLPFIVVYQVKNNIQILAVLHSSRKWSSNF